MMKPRQRVAIAGVLLVAAALAGCDLAAAPKPSPSSAASGSGAIINTPVPSPSMEPGYTLHADTVEGYAIAFPDTWNFLFADSPTYDNDLKGIASSASELATYFSDGYKSAQGSGLKLMAAEPRSVESGFVTNMSVFKSDLGPPDRAPDVDAISSSKRTLIRKGQNIQGDIKHERVQIPAGTAERIQYTLKPADATVSVNTYLLTADFPGRRVLYEIIGGTTVADYATLFDRIARSFRLLPGAPGPTPSQGSAPTQSKSPNPPR